MSYLDGSKMPAKRSGRWKKMKMSGLLVMVFAVKKSACFVFWVPWFDPVRGSHVAEPGLVLDDVDRIL